MKYFKILESHKWVLSGDNGDELFVVDSSVSVLISIVDHLINFLGSESLTDGLSNLLELFRAEAVGSVEIEDLIKFPQRSLSGVLWDTEDLQESGEVEFLSIGVGLHNGDDGLGIILEAQSLDGVDDFFGGDLTTVIIIKNVEDFLQLEDGLKILVLVHVLSSVESLS